MPQNGPRIVGRMVYNAVKFPDNFLCNFRQCQT